MSDSSSSNGNGGDLPFPETPSTDTATTTTTTLDKYASCVEWDISLPSIQESTQVVVLDNERVGRRLKAILGGISAPFCCGGVARLAEDVQVMITSPDMKEEIITVKPPLFSSNGHLFSGRTESWEFTDEYLQQQTDILRMLVDNAPVAPLGKGKETLVDPSVRNAKQIKCDDSTFINIIPDIDLQSVLEQIQTELGLSYQVAADPYSINIYEKGGKFLKHKDTPRGKDMFGTLVLCLPSLFRGGALTVEMGDQTHSYFGDFTNFDGDYQESKSGHEDWWPHPMFRDRQADASQIPWCAFFSGVDHQVQEVTAGVRVTMTYLLRRMESSTAAMSSPLPRTLGSVDQKTMALVVAIGEYMADESFLPKGGKIAFPCEHLYTNSQVFPNQQCSNDVLSLQAIQSLKGRDLVVAQAALDRLGLCVYLKPLVKHQHTTFDRGDYYLTKFPDYKHHIPPRMSDEEIEQFFDTDFQKCPEEMADIWVTNIDDGAGEKYGSCQWNPIGYFGNEATDIEFYIRSFLLIQIPAYQDRQSLICRTSVAKQN